MVSPEAASPEPSIHPAQGRDHVAAIHERALLLARREVLAQRLQRLREVQEFEQRLAVLRDVPGWRYVRQGRRAFLQRIVRPQERFFAYVLVHQKALVYEARLRGERAMAHGALAGALYWVLLGLPFALLWAVVWAQQRVYVALVRSERLFVRGVVVLPTTIQSGYQATMEELRDAEARRTLWRALWEERLHTPQRRRALVFLATWMFVVGWLIAEAYMRTFDRASLPYKHTLDLLFFYGAATRLFLPVPLEFAIPPAAERLGAVLAVLGAAVGGVVGSWILYLVGDKANRGLDQWVKKRAWTRRAWAWTERNAARAGYFIMGGVLAIPFAPDSITAVFAVLGMRLRWFLLTVFAATTFRLSIYLALR